MVHLYQDFEEPLAEIGYIPVGLRLTTDQEQEVKVYMALNIAQVRMLPAVVILFLP